MATEELEKRHAKLQQLLEAWREDRDPHDEGFARDGIVDVDAFAQADPKVLLVLKDPSTKPGERCVDSLCDWFLDGDSAYGSTWFNVARWAESFLPPEDRHIDRRSRPNRDAAGEALRRVAVLNLKKTAGGTTADYLQVSAHAARDAKRIRQEIRLIDPEVIVGCGVYEPLFWLLGLTPEEVETVPKEKGAVHVVRSSGRPAVILTRHPTRAPKSVAKELAEVWEGGTKGQRR